MDTRGEIKYDLCLFTAFDELLRTYNVANYSQLIKIPDLTPESLERIVRFKFGDSFPYTVTLDKVFEKSYARTVEDLETGIHPRQYINFLKENYFVEELEHISSSYLFHFIPPEFLLSTLLNRRLFPTTPNIFEYFFNPEKILPESNRREWFDCLNKYMDETKRNFFNKGNSSAQDLAESVLRSSLPIYSCFSDIGIKNITFHAAHYGAYGIAFKKQQVLERINLGTRHESKIGPVAYFDPLDSYSIKLLMEKVCESPTNEAKRYAMDLFSIKPLINSDLLPENYYSPFFEREWRYISMEKCFEFELEDIAFITIPSQSLNRHFFRLGRIMAPVKFISEVMDFADKHKIKIHSVESKLDTDPSGSLESDRSTDDLYEKNQNLK